MCKILNIVIFWGLTFGDAKNIEIEITKKVIITYEHRVTTLPPHPKTVKARGEVPNIVHFSFILNETEAGPPPQIESRLMKKNSNWEHTTIEKASWQVGLFDLDILRFLGSGSIISERWVLTAARCVCKDNGSGRIDQNFSIYSGHSVYFRGTKHQVRNVLCHPKYKKMRHLTKDSGPPIIYVPINDVALVRSNDTFKFNQVRNVVPINCDLIPDDFDAGTTVNIHGWSAYRREPEDLHKHIRKGMLNMMSKKKCNGEVSKRVVSRNLKRKEQCLEARNKNLNCFFDWGSPVIKKSNLIGIVSWAPVRTASVYCDSELPIIYTDISGYCTWINKHVRTLNKTNMSQNKAI